MGNRFSSTSMALGLVLLAGMALAPSALAGAPASQELNPPPPDFYTCGPNGSGTICHAQTSDAYGPDPSAIFCAGAGGTFEVLDQGVRNVDATRWYDRNGNLVKRVRDIRFADTKLSNPSNGRFVSYSQHDIDIDLLSTPGDLDSRTTYSEGSLLAVVVGIGAVLVERGRTIIAADGTILAQSGRHDLSDYYAGDATMVVRLCAVLGA